MLPEEFLLDPVTIQGRTQTAGIVGEDALEVGRRFLDLDVVRDDRLEDVGGGDDLVEAGMVVVREDGGVYDRFRDRLVIPIRDPRGRTIAFGGRIIGEGEPKYLNSPETPLFRKGELLYNLNNASVPARQQDRLLVVGGEDDQRVVGQAQLVKQADLIAVALVADGLVVQVGDPPL